MFKWRGKIYDVTFAFGVILVTIVLLATFLMPVVQTIRRLWTK
jgi:hypothetical protein